MHKKEQDRFFGHLANLKTLQFHTEGNGDSPNLDRAEAVLLYLERIHSFKERWERITKEMDSPYYTDRVISAFAESEEFLAAMIADRSAKT